jgi:hypothetical protein
MVKATVAQLAVQRPRSLEQAGGYALDTTLLDAPPFSSSLQCLVQCPRLPPSYDRGYSITSSLICTYTFVHIVITPFQPRKLITRQQLRKVSFAS